MATSTFGSQVVPNDSTQKQGRIWIPGASLGPFDIADGGDEIGEWGGVNAATTEVLTYIMPIPWDMDVTAACSLQDTLVFDGVSDDDIFEIDHLYTIVLPTATTDPVHVVPATAFTSEDAALTIVEATHESRIYQPGAATLAASTLTAAQQTARALMVLGWEITITTMTEDEFILVGSEFIYTKRFL